MNKIIILKGLPASGKTTWARQFIKDNPSYVRINLDDIRSMLGQKWSKDLEYVAKKTQLASIIQAFGAGFDVVLDNTNLNKDSLFWLTRRITSSGVKIEYKHFDTPLEECVERDKARVNSVGEEVIKEMYNKYLKQI